MAATSACSPALVGNAAAGSHYGIFANVLLYLPLVIWLRKVRYSPRAPAAPRLRPGPASGEIVRHSARAAGNRPMIATRWAGPVRFIGNAYQAQMPGFAEDLGFHNAGFAYAALMAADAAGAIGAVLLLEGRGLLSATPGRALLLGACWCLAMGGFALAHGIALTLALLFAAGFFELSFSAMAQTIVQMRSPVDQRGRIMGLFITASLDCAPATSPSAWAGRVSGSTIRSP